MNTPNYLHRIEYRGPIVPDAETLRRLQKAHLLTVPFENLSIHASEPIVLDVDALYDKIVRRRRGGFCYELNGLFAALLRSLGFEVTLLAAEVMGNDSTFGPLFDHMALLVTLSKRWLVDVGFGDSFRAPLQLDERDEQRENGRSFRIDAVDDERFLLLQRDGQDPWQPQYRFDLEPHALADYAPMCRYHQTSPDSHFTRQIVCSRMTSDGRVTLSQQRLIVTRNGIRHEHRLADGQAALDALRESFGIEMPGLKFPQPDTT